MRERYNLGKADFTHLDCYAIAAWLALKVSKWQALGHRCVHCVHVTLVGVLERRSEKDNIYIGLHTATANSIYISPIPISDAYLTVVFHLYILHEFPFRFSYRDLGSIPADGAHC